MTAVPGNRWDLLPEPSGPVPTVGVVVCHYEQPEQLARTVAAVHRQTRPPVAVVVADDGSARPPDPATLAGPVPLQVLGQDDRGFRAAAARNLGAARCDGDVLVFLDADTVPEPGFIDALTRRIRACPDVLAVGRRRHADLSGTEPGTDPARAPRLPEPRWLADGYRGSRDLLDADGRSFRFVISAVLALHRTLFDDIGGFDERFVGYGGEDWDLAYRAWNNGALLVHEPGAVAWHDGPDWAGRPGPGKDGEAMRLAALVPEPGTRGAPLPGAVPDVLADPGPGLTGTALVRTVDSVLRQTHRDVRVRLPGGDDRITELYRGVADTAPWSADRVRRARARLEVHAPLPPDALATAMDLMVRHDLGRVEIVGAGHDRLAVLGAARAAGRARRHGVGGAEAQWREGTATLRVDDRTGG
ncbi:glycosyltransferase [Pseudonocardia sp. HH130630-07]|uniref:glycosyltransferase n=1 Tax=Pseudonocardia sp. HH130630-07 TaxID=1690815 RepID=UPI000A48834D|nr:glycosyltransferase [Pseudonocardia sp. HH130630-07]